MKEHKDIRSAKFISDVVLYIIHFKFFQFLTSIKLLRCCIVDAIEPQIVFSQLLSPTKLERKRDGHRLQHNFGPPPYYGYQVKFHLLMICFFCECDSDHECKLFQEANQVQYGH